MALYLQTQDNQLPGVTRSMRTPVLVLFLAVSGVLVVGEQTSDTPLQVQLKQLFPAATSFSPKEGNPPHFKAYRDAGNGGEPTLLGFAFYTTELEPLERGYDGPIQVFVGMDTGWCADQHRRHRPQRTLWLLLDRPSRIRGAVRPQEHPRSVQGG